MKKTILVAINAKYIHSCLAIYSLRANAGKWESQVELAEYTINHRKEDILSDLYRKKPELVGFSCYIWNIEYVLDICEDLKKILPQVQIVVGGPEVSYNAEEILRKYDFIETVMVGEGENTFREYLDCMEKGGSLEKVDGLCFRKGEEIVFSAPRQAMSMDDLIFPYRDLEDMEHRIIYYETIRGCPFSCSYCLSSIEKRVRLRSLDLVYEELDFFLKNKVPQVKFVDRTFNCNHEHAYGIWQYILEHDNGITNFHFEIGGDLLREEDFLLFEKFRPGLIQFEIGVQSTNLDTIDAIRRTMDIEELARRTERVRKRENIHQHLDLIAGLPHEDYESFHKSFNDVYAMRPDQFQLGFLKVLKGSYMNEKKGDYNLKYGSKPPYEVLSTKWLSYDDVLALKRVEEMVEVYYNSFQFTMSMILLENMEKDAFSMYQRLGDYYDKKGLFQRKHSRLSRYEILWDYVREELKWEEKQREMFRQCLTYDMYTREYAKNPPNFVERREDAYLRNVREFLDQESQELNLLQGYEGYTSKQLFNMVYVTDFSLNFELLWKEKKLSVGQNQTYVFDYRNRNPLNGNASIKKMPSLADIER